MNTALHEKMKNIGKFLGLIEKEKLIDFADISFSQFQLEEAIYQSLVKNKEIPYENHELKLTYIGKDDIYIKCEIRKEEVSKNFNFSKVDIEQALFDSMLAAGEVSPHSYAIELSSHMENDQISTQIKASLVQNNTQHRVVQPK